MSRDITATNLAEINAAHLHGVILAKLEFGTPVYCHSGIGTITYDGDDYLGVGQFGNISNATETELLRVTSMTLSLSGVDANLLSEGLDSGTYGDVVTLFVGYRQDDGTLVDDPWVLWKGILEYASIRQGAENVIQLTAKYDLAVLDDKHGGRFTDEDQQTRFTGDIGFQYVTDMPGQKIRWAGGWVDTGAPFVLPPWKDDSF